MPGRSIVAMTIARFDEAKPRVTRIQPVSNLKNQFANGRARRTRSKPGKRRRGSSGRAERRAQREAQQSWDEYFRGLIAEEHELMMTIVGEALGEQRIDIRDEIGELIDKALREPHWVPRVAGVWKENEEYGRLNIVSKTGPHGSQSAITRKGLRVGLMIGCSAPVVARPARPGSARAASRARPDHKASVVRNSLAGTLTASGLWLRRFSMTAASARRSICASVQAVRGVP